VEEIADRYNPVNWRDAKLALIDSDGYSVASDGGFFHKFPKASGENRD
jgi:hypothetical protein